MQGTGRAEKERQWSEHLPWKPELSGWVGGPPKKFEERALSFLLAAPLWPGSIHPSFNLLLVQPVVPWPRNYSAWEPGSVPQAAK